jgi:hypothetical protein
MSDSRCGTLALDLVMIVEPAPVGWFPVLP